MSLKLPPGVRKAHKAAADKKYYQEHREKIQEYLKQYRKDNPDKKNSLEYMAAYYLKRDHCMTTKQKDEWLEFQDNKCASCGTNDPGGKHKAWCIDHDHKTNIPRGILCNACNLALGYLYDDPCRIFALAAYLQRKPDFSFEVL